MNLYLELIDNALQIPSYEWANLTLYYNILYTKYPFQLAFIIVSVLVLH
jgi:hypothetical protein